MAVCSELQEAAERPGHGLISNGILVCVERDWFEPRRLHERRKPMRTLACEAAARPEGTGEDYLYSAGCF